MSDTVVHVDHLSKKYRLGVLGTGTLRHDFNRWWHRVRGKEDPYVKVREHSTSSSPSTLSTTSISSPLRDDEIWALRDVSLEVKQGEILGIVGKNGAGKSTLLKILSRVTAPTSGEVKVKGRIASLLEVGTGFHPELTGRENVFLNGAILGMTKTEVRRKLDEIIAFAEIEKFIETPVKRYSSGMYVRLAFAVAAHFDPEILIVDEVLAVGDASFQKKCLGKMGQVAKRGRTVLFVSHNMAAVRSLCSRGILICEGRIATTGEVPSVIGSYLQRDLSLENNREWPDPAQAPGTSEVKLHYVRVRPPDGETVLTIDTGATLEIGFFNFLEGANLDCTIYVTNSEGVLLFESGCIVSCHEDSIVGHYRTVGHIPPHLLNAGQYYLHVQFGKDQRYIIFRIDDVISFEVGNTNTGRGLNMSIAPGLVRPLLHWRHTFAPQSGMNDG